MKNPNTEAEDFVLCDYRKPVTVKLAKKWLAEKDELAKEELVELVYPNAQKQSKSYKIESTVLPGVFINFQREMLSEITPDKRATLSFPTGKFTFTLTDLSKLSADQLEKWEALMQNRQQTNMNQYFASVKIALVEIASNIELSAQNQLDTSQQNGGPSTTPLDPLTYLGWYHSGEYSDLIFGAPSAVFASKRILEPMMQNYSESIEAQAQKAKAELQKESESSSGF